MKIHLWEAYNPTKISVDLNKELKDKIAKEINQDIYKIADKLDIIPARLYDYFIYQTSPIPLNILINLSKLFKISLIQIEQDIIMYKQMFVPNKNSIKNPKLPLEVNPYFTSLLANLFFDGSVPRDGKGTYYNQKNKEIMDDFIKKLKHIFGDVDCSLRLDHRGVLKCRMPRIIGEICRHIYNVESFGTFDAKIPKGLYKLNKEHKISFILTGIIDEGSITYDGSVIFSISNREMIGNFNRLCVEIGLNTGGVKQKRNSNHYYLYILSIEVLLNIINNFGKKYPLISLRNKAERLAKSLEIKNQEYFNTKKFSDKRKSLILKELNPDGCSINHLTNKLLIHPRTIRRYMYQLIKENKVSRLKKSNEYIYSLG